MKTEALNLNESKERYTGMESRKGRERLYNHNLKNKKYFTKRHGKKKLETTLFV